MHLMNEDMARAHSALRLEELLRHERSRRVVAAHRAQRRAERPRRAGAAAPLPRQPSVIDRVITGSCEGSTTTTAPPGA